MLFLCSFLFCLGITVGIDNENMNPSNSFSHVSKEDYKARTNGEIQGCVMVNRYDESPTTLVVTCRGDDDGDKDVDTAGIVFYDVTKDDQPKYIKHWRSPSASVEGQDSINETLVVVGFDGKLLTFDKWTQQLKNGGALTPTAELQTSSRSLLHVKTFNHEGRNYAFMSTGFSFNGLGKGNKMCDVLSDENDYRCGVTDLAEKLEAQGEKVTQADEDRFDGVIIVDITDPANPKEISKVCLKVKCPEGTSIFFDIDEKPYGTVGGVNSEYLAVIDLSDPHNPVIVTQEHKSHLNQLVPLYGIHPALGPNGLYEAYANWGIDGGITVWNFTTPSHPHEAAYLDSSDCANSNRAIFWNERYLLTPLESVGYGGVCVFDLCEVNKPKFRAYMHLEHFGSESLSIPGPRTVYGMNAYKDHAYFAVYNRDFLQTYKINMDKIYNHVTEDQSDMRFFETESVYLKGFDAATCDVGEETTEPGRFLNANEIYMLVAGASALLVLICICLVCVCCTHGDATKSAEEKYLDDVWTSKGGVKKSMDVVI